MQEMPQVQQALEEGARRSRAACMPTFTERTLMRTAETSSGPRNVYINPAVQRETLTPEVVWRRFKWLIVALGMFLLVELLSMGKLVSVMGTHF